MTTGYIKREKSKLVDRSEWVVKKETVAEVLTYPILEVKSRGLSKETCELFGVRTALSERDGKTPIAHYFPAYNQKDEIVGFMKRDLTKDKADDYHFTTIGTYTTPNKLFGQNIAEKVDRKHTALIAVEGQWDVMSVYQAVLDGNKGTTYEGMQPFVVGLNCGTVNAVESFFHNKQFVDGFTEVCLAFDNDKCSPKELEKGFVRGEECKSAVAAALKHPNTTTLNYGAFKDASDYIQGGFSKELNKLVSFSRLAYTPDKLVSADAISLDELLRPRATGVLSEIFPKLDAKLKGFRLRELTMMLAPSNVGKTSVCAALANRFMENGHKIGMVMLEESLQDTLQRLVAAHLGVNFNHFRENPMSVGFSREEIEAAFDWVKSTGVVVLDHFGSLPIHTLMEKLKYMVYAQGVKYIILDHVSMLVSGMRTTDERKELDITMTELAAFCASNDVHILAVSHINRSNAADFKAPKELKEGESFWVSVTKESMRGSAALEQLSWNIIGIEPEILWDRSRGRVRLVLLKNREQAHLGVCDVFQMDDESGKFVLDVEPTLD